MKTLTCLLILGSMLPGLGQNRFSLSVQVAPVYAYSDSKFIFPFPDPITQLPTTEVTTVSNVLNYSLGIAVGYAFSSKWSIASGVWATHSAIGKGDFSENGVRGTMRYQYSHPFTNSYKVPLLINFKSSTKRLSPYFSAGATFDFRGISYVDLEGNGTYVPVKFGKALIVRPLIGAGVLYGLTEHMSLIVQPTIQYDLEPHPGYSYYHAYQLGLQTQLMYRF